MENLETWNSIMAGRTNVKSCILIDCPETELERRILDRGRSSGRSDDTKETVKKRFATFRESTLPVIEFFAESNKLVSISGDKSEGEVWHDLQALFVEKFIDQTCAVDLDCSTNSHSSTNSLIT